MLTLYMTKGLPASGKTTWAKAKLQELGSGKATRVNKDDLRAMMHSEWSEWNEKEILEARDNIILGALAKGKHVIVDDTNLVPKHEAALRDCARRNNIAFEVVDFTHVSLDECIARDQKRPNYVGEKVIRKMWKRYLQKPEVYVKPEWDWELPAAIVVDLDGTLAHNVTGRSYYDLQRVGEDAVDVRIASLLDRLGGQHVDQDTVIIVSGRDNTCRAETAGWLKYYEVVYDKLFMRPEGDTRDDAIVKREIYEREIKGKYNVRVVLDDRNKVVDMWRSLGLTCLQVADGDF